MEILEDYSFKLWRSYHRTALNVMLRDKKNMLSRSALTRLAKMLFQTKRLCQFVDAQIDQWKSGVYTTWPVDPRHTFTPDRQLAFSLGYGHMHPEIQRFMDWAGVQYSVNVQ